MAEKMGFQGLLYYGTAGSTAATLIEDARDVTISIDVDKASTTKRGNGTTVPIKTEAAVAIGWQMEFSVVNNPTNATVNALRTAAVAGTQIAFRTKDYTSGKGYDGDCTIAYKENQPIGGEQTLDFTVTPTCETRAPSLNA